MTISPLPVVSVLALIWFIRYIFFIEFTFPNHVIIIKAKGLLTQAEVT
jgi:hypothetical protein